MAITLEELEREVLRDPMAPSSVISPVRKLNYSHRGMIDLIVANPGISQNQIAAAIGYSASWVSTVMSSDAFQMALAERVDEIVDPLLKITMKERLEGAAKRSLEILLEKLDRPSSAIGDQFALRAFEITSRAAGYGARVEPTREPPGNVEVHLNFMGDRLVELLRTKRAEASLLIEQETVHVAKQG